MLATLTGFSGAALASPAPPTAAAVPSTESDPPTDPATPPSESPGGERPIGIDARFATYGGMGRGAWIFAELGAGGWIVPHLAWGGYVALSIANDPMEADCSNRQCMTHEYKLGTRLRFHLFPDLVVDPWLGVSAGARLDAGNRESKAGLDVGVLLGVDVRLGQFAFGPYGFIDQPLTKYDEIDTWDGQFGLGVHFDVRF
jgi:hypothetical protein